MICNDNCSGDRGDMGHGAKRDNVIKRTSSCRFFFYVLFYDVFVSSKLGGKNAAVCFDLRDFTGIRMFLSQLKMFILLKKTAIQ